MATGPKKVETRGGTRANAGRPRIEISDYEVKKLLKAARKKEKETGKSVYDILMDMIYSGREKERGPGLRMFLDTVISRSKQQDVKVTTTNAPAVYLPEQRPDPAKLEVVKRKVA